MLYLQHGRHDIKCKPSIGFAQPVRPAQPHILQQPYPSTPPIYRNANINLKKTPLPTFSGQISDWPECKAVWKQLAESVYTSKTTLAHELKRSVKEEAIQQIGSVYMTGPEAYDEMWTKLEAHYDDASASVQAALSGLQRLKPAESEDYQALVDLVDEVEAAYCQLQEFDHLNILTMRDVDHISKFLPNHMRLEWICKYADMPSPEKVRPIPTFHEVFGTRARACIQISRQSAHKKEVPQTAISHQC